MKTIYSLLVILVFSISANAACRMDTLYQFKFAPGSSIKENEYRTVFTYNALNLETERMQQKWNAGTASYINFEKHNTTYNTDNLILTETMTVWNTTSTAWDNFSKTNYYYNAAKKLTTYQHLSWNNSITFGWTLKFQRDYTYNAANNVEIYNLWEYSVSTGILTNSVRIYYAYDASQNNIERLTQKHNTTIGTLENQFFETNTFNAANDNTETISQTWVSGAWKNSNRYVNTFTPTHKISETVAQRFGTTAWEADLKTVNTYTSFDSLLLTTYERWNTSIGGWVNSTRIIYDYNVDRQLKEKKVEEYSIALSGWKNYGNETFEYNADKNLSAKDGYSNWMSGGYYNSHYREEYICTNMPTAIKENSVQNDLEIYPNPVTSNLFFIDSKSNHSFSLFNLNGQSLQNGILKNGTNTIDVSGLSSGLYFMKIGNEVQKIIIQ